jgi:hypothetical protein
MKLRFQYEIGEVKGDERDQSGTANQDKHYVRIMQDLNKLVKLETVWRTQKI